MDKKTNLLVSEVTISRVSLLFLFVTVCSLGLALIATGVIAVLGKTSERVRLAPPKEAFQASKLVTAESNEKANPGSIGLYLGEKFAGAILENGSFSLSLEPPPAGTLALLFLNPTTTPLPTTVEFPAQKISVFTNTGKTVVCIPPVAGDTTLWVNTSGNTYLDQQLTKLARSCAS